MVELTSRKIRIADAIREAISSGEDRIAMNVLKSFLHNKHDLIEKITERWYRIAKEELSYYPPDFSKYGVYGIPPLEEGPSIITGYTQSAQGVNNLLDIDQDIIPPILADYYTLAQLEGGGFAVYLQDTQQIYIDEVVEKLGREMYAHEYVHYLLDGVRPPLVVEEGLAMISSRISTQNLLVGGERLFAVLEIADCVATVYAWSAKINDAHPAPWFDSLTELLTAHARLVDLRWKNDTFHPLELSGPVKWPSPSVYDIGAVSISLLHDLYGDGVLGEIARGEFA